jgi:hypothetical protein
LSPRLFRSLSFALLPLLVVMPLTSEPVPLVSVPDEPLRPLALFAPALPACRWVVPAPALLPPFPPLPSLPAPPIELPEAPVALPAEVPAPLPDDVPAPLRADDSVLLPAEVPVPFALEACAPATAGARNPDSKSAKSVFLMIVSFLGSSPR